MYKTTNLPTPKMTPKGMQYPNEPGSEGSINSIDDFLLVGRSIALYIDGPKYDPMENILKGRAMQNVSIGSVQDAEEKLNEIFKSLYKCKNDTREISLEIRMAESDKYRSELEEEKRQIEYESWPSLRDDMVDWWKKYVDPNVKFEKTDQDPNLGAEPSRADFYARTGYTRDPEDMSESLLRRYIKSVLT